MESSLFERLPAELIGIVFQHCLPGKPSFSPTEAPLVLTQVCRVWRKVALQTPQLWSRFIVPDWQELPPDVGRLIKLWVERSGETPLDVDIKLFNEDILIFPDSDTLTSLYKMLKELLELLGRRRSQIGRFRGVFPSFLMDDVGVSEMTNAEFIYYCGMLGENMTLQNVDEVIAEQKKLDVGPQRDSLRSLAICGCVADLQSIRIQEQLEHLELVDLYTGGDLCQENAFELLQSLPKLKVCIMDLTRFERQDWTPPTERIVLRNLELLFLSWVFPADIDLLLRSIAAPKLTKLGLRGTPMVAQRPWTGLLDFLEASKAPIQRISLGDFGAVDAQLLGCFAQLPELAHLTINHCEIPDDIFRKVTCTDGLWDSSLLPKLQIFNMGVCEGFQLETVKNFLRSRVGDTPEGVRKLSEVAIMYCMSITEKHKSELEEIGVENLILEAAEDDTVYPYARVVETHRELLAVLYSGDDEDIGYEEDDEDEHGEDEESEESGEDDAMDIDEDESNETR